MSSILTPDDDSTVDAYEKPIFGFHGKFQTKNSLPLSFFQTSIPIEQIDLLKTAGEALEPEHFKELIQRDIDEERVKKIVETYLERKNMVLFFPPLIASVIAHDNNKTVHVYEDEKHEPTADGKGIVSEWGERFRVSVPTDTRDTGYTYRGENSKPYWTNFQIKRNKVHLVVIDGQHRLSALKKLKEKDPEVCAGMDIPVCIVYSPNAVAGNPESETITTDVRELFVRINNTGKQVSGHFLTLLKDGDVTAITVREICEYAKSVKLENGATLLNLLEWNERSSKRASQLNKPYSLTSVGILSDVFERFGFAQKDGIPATLLRLKSKEDELYSREPFLNIDEINSDAEIPATQFDTLEELAREEIAPALVTLFTKPEPYQELIKAFEAALGSLDKDVTEDKKGAKIYKRLLVKEFREVNDFDRDSVKDARDLFSEQVASYLGRTSLSIYQHSVFQQGYIRAWIDLCKKLSRFEIPNAIVAELFVAAASHSVFDTHSDIFDVSKNYTDLTLYKNQKIQQPQHARSLWKHLILACLLNPVSQETLAKSLQDHSTDSDKIMTVLNKELLEESLDNYINKRKNANRKYYLDNWKSMEDTIDAENFEQLLTFEAENNDDSNSQQVTILEKLSDKKFVDVRDKLKSAIGIG